MSNWEKKVNLFFLGGGSLFMLNYSPFHMILDT